MKINIQFKFRNGPWGGANQFLVLLKDNWSSKSIYSDSPYKSDGILINSHHNFWKVIFIKFFFPNKIIIHRIDGPAKLSVNLNDKRDELAYMINELVADATIFQSEYSYKANLNFGMKISEYHTVIINGTDSSIFYKKPDKHTLNIKSKINIISSSWSPNKNKGFETYKWLDENLDFDKFDYLFIGNSSMLFKNIRILKPQNRSELANSLRNSDIYITASQKEACSNSLIEAISTGLPSIALNDGSNSEVILGNGELFNTNDEIPQKIEKIISHYDKYVYNDNRFEMENVALKYYQFFEEIKEQNQRKKISIIKLIIFVNKYIFYKLNLILN